MKRHVTNSLCVWSLLAVWALPCASLSGCKTVDSLSVTQFKQGLSTVYSNSRSVLLECNQSAREVQLDRVEKLPNIKESDVASALDAESLSRWNRAFEVLVLYSSALETLAGTNHGKAVEASLQLVGDQIIKLNPPRDSDESTSDELTRAISHIGGLIVQAAAGREALKLARDADPNVRAVLFHMANMIGADYTKPGVRKTMWSNWTVVADEQRVEFLSAGDRKRQVAAAYAKALEGRQTGDSALGALHKALIDLADLHTAMAQGRTASASEIITVLGQELSFAKTLLESAHPAKSDGGEQ